MFDIEDQTPEEKKTRFKVELEQYISEYIHNGTLDMKDIKVLESNATQQYLLKKRSDPDHQPKEYLSFEIGLCAYIRILENGGTAQDALEYAAYVHDKPIEYIEDVKNRKFFYAKQVVNQADQHRVQNEMFKYNSIDRNALKSSSTANQQLRKLSMYKSVDDRLNNLEHTVSEHQENLEDLETRLAVREQEIEQLKSIVGMNSLDPIEICGILKQKGISQKKIAAVTGKSLSTIKRWWKEV